MFLAALLLFPCISVSDDYARARLEDRNSDPSSNALAGYVANGTGFLLAMQLEETEHIRPVVPFALVLVLYCLLVILPVESDSMSALAWGTSARAPPSF